MSQDVGPDVPGYPSASWGSMGFSKTHKAALLRPIHRTGVICGMACSEDASATAAGKDQQGNKYMLGHQEQYPASGTQNAAAAGSSGVSTWFTKFFYVIRNSC